MKSRLLSQLVFVGVILAAGIVLGAVFQKYVGIGNMLRDIGIPYPTAEIPMTTNRFEETEIPQAYQGKIRLFILAGQSNMVGWAPIPEPKEGDPRIYVFGNDYRWRIATDPIDDAFNQVDKVSEDRIADYGPAMAFALTSLKKNPEIVIGLVPCAKNSSAIGQWQRNLSDQTLYGSCLKRARAASSMGQFAGILFFQGETDAVDPIQYPHPEPYPTEWGQLFKSFVADFRNDLGEPDLPVVFAQLGSNSTPEAFPNWDLVKEQQRTIQLPMIKMIKTDDLPLMDGLHFSTGSYQIIGQRFAETYWDLIEQP